MGSVILAVVFVALGLQALREAAQGLTGAPGNPLSLGILQTLVAISALAAGHGAWHRSKWGPWAAAAYGVVTGTMVALLGPILDLPDEARPGLLASGVLILVIGLGLAKWMQVLHRPTTPS